MHTKGLAAAAAAVTIVCATGASADGAGGAPVIELTAPTTEVGAAKRSRPGGLSATTALSSPTAGTLSTSISLGSLNGSNGFRTAGPSNGYTGYSTDAGDVNGDGIPDTVIASPGANAFAGAIYVLFGRSTAWPASPTLPPAAGTGVTISGAVASNLGLSVSVADVDGDGIDDIIAASLGSDGTVHVVYGRAGLADLTVGALDPATTGFTVTVSGTGGGLRRAVGGFDFNDDGRSEIILGVPTADPSGLSGAGSAFVVFGAAKASAANVTVPGAPATQAFRIDGTEAGEQLGYAVSGGDFNGDGYGDAIVGNPNYDGAGTLRGRAGLLLGFAATPSATYTMGDLFGFTSATDNGSLGVSVSGTADVNGDGLKDLLLGQSGANASAGRAWVVYGSRRPAAADLDTLPLSRGYRIDGELPSDAAGVVVEGLGDFNGDGLNDVGVMNSYSSIFPDSLNGTLYVVYGRTGSTAGNVDLADLTSDRGAYVNGKHLDAAGYPSLGGPGQADINRDGFADVVVGAPYAPLAGVVFSGAAGVVFGRPSGPIDRTGTAASEFIPGSPWEDRLDGGAGNDTIRGNADEDVLIGGPGKDTLTGGADNDTFVYRRVSDSPPTSAADVITDFSVTEDVIDLSRIDARWSAAGNQAFTFIGTKAFSGPGQLRYQKVNPSGTANDVTRVEVSTDGDLQPELRIVLRGLKTLSTGNFVR